VNQANLFEMFGLTEDVASEGKFIPRRLKAVPDTIAELPEKTEGERIAKVKAVLKWLMVNFPTSFSYSGGKDSSAVLGLAMAAAAELAAAGEKIKPFAVLNADTLVENPRVHAVTKGELAKLRAWISRHKLPGTVHVARPNLISQFAVSIIGQGSLPSTPETKRDCTVDWKSRPLSKLRKAVLGTNDVRSGQYVVSVTGVRYIRPSIEFTR
jgi:3'-phosphoadenosine 5'-phosphosulfate sulfotransferase (PAPS reductase)/FAD synthetase